MKNQSIERNPGKSYSAACWLQGDWTHFLFSTSLIFLSLKHIPLDSYHIISRLKVEKISICWLLVVVLEFHRDILFDHLPFRGLYFRRWGGSQVALRAPAAKQRPEDAVGDYPIPAIVNSLHSGTQQCLGNQLVLRIVLSLTICQACILFI